LVGASNSSFDNGAQECMTLGALMSSYGNDTKDVVVNI